MVYLLALLIFVGLSAACWYGSVAVYRGTVGGPDPVATPDYHTTAAAAVGVTALTSFVPFPFGYLAGLVVWAVAAFGASACPPAGPPSCSCTWRRVHSRPGCSYSASWTCSGSDRPAPPDLV